MLFRNRYSPECEDDGSEDKEEGNDVVPAKGLAEIEIGKGDKYDQGDGLLDHLQLIAGELAVANAVRGNLEAIFAERDQPTHHDRFYQGCGPMFQVSVPGEGHEGVGDEQQGDG